MKTYQWFQMQLYCNYIATYAIILQLYSQILVSGQMQLYCILCNYATILLMQLYSTYATICNYMQLYCNYMQLYCNNFIYATICNYATCNLCNLSNLCNLCNFMQLYATYATICNLCNYATICNYMTDRCGNFNFMQLNAYMQLCWYYIATYATICNYMQLYATTILQQFCMQLYANMQLYATMQHATYATLWNLCNFTQLYCNLCNYIATYATICNLCVAISTLCNYMTDRCGNFNFMQLNATICNCVGTKNIYWHDNLSSCFNECRYHQIGICRIYIPRVMIKI
jgi:hypothetical protein